MEKKLGHCFVQEINSVELTNVGPEIQLNPKTAPKELVKGLEAKECTKYVHLSLRESYFIMA